MAQQIRELMTPNPVVLPGTASVHEAARAMRDAEIGDVIGFTPYFGDSRKRSTVCGACPPSRREHVLPSRESLASLVCTTSARMARLWASAPCLLSRLMAGTPGVLTRHT
jgi:hypothetical protein